MIEVEEPTPRSRRRSGRQRMISFLVNGLHGGGAIAAAFLTSTFVTLNLLKFFNLADSTSHWLFFGLTLLSAIVFAAVYAFGIGAVLDWLRFALLRRTADQRSVDLTQR